MFDINARENRSEKEVKGIKSWERSWVVSLVKLGRQNEETKSHEVFSQTLSWDDYYKHVQPFRGKEACQGESGSLQTLPILIGGWEG